MSKKHEVWRERVPPLLVEIADTCAAALRDSADMPDDQAAYLGYILMRRIAEVAGGAQIYIPKSDAIDRCLRDEEIMRHFDGQNHRALARQYGVSEIHIYRIVKAMRERERDRRQMPLF